MFDTTFYICIHYDGAQTAGAQTAGAQMSSRPNGGAQTAAPKRRRPEVTYPWCEGVYHHGVSYKTFAGFPRNKGDTIRSFPIRSQKSLWLVDCRKPGFDKALYIRSFTAPWRATRLKPS